MTNKKATAKTKNTTSTNQAPTGTVSTVSDEVVTECIEALDQVAAKLGDGEPLDNVQIRHSTKMPKGGAAIIPQMIALCQQHGVTQIGSLTTTEMSETFERGNAVMQVGKHVDVVRKKVGDMGLATHGRTWRIATTMYATLLRMSADDPNLALGLQSVQSFFKKKKKRKTAGATPQAPTTVAAKPVAETPAPSAGAVPGNVPAGSPGAPQPPPPAPEAQAETVTPPAPPPATH